MHPFAEALEPVRDNESSFLIEAEINKTVASLVIHYGAVLTHGRNCVKLVHYNPDVRELYGLKEINATSHGSTIKQKEIQQPVKHCNKYKG